MVIVPLPATGSRYNWHRCYSWCCLSAKRLFYTDGLVKITFSSR